MEFKSMVNPHEPHKFAEGGFKKTFDIYEEIINPKTGKKELKKTGEEPFYEKIQAMKDSQILENVIKRYNIDLNNNKITEISDEIIDLTKAPEDLIEMYAITKRLENLYEDSTSEIKNHFKNFGGFLKSFQNGTLKSELTELHKAKKQPAQPTPAQPTPAQQNSQPAQQNQNLTIKEGN